MWKLQTYPRQAWVAAPEIFTVEELDRIDALQSNNKQAAVVGEDGVVPAIRNSVIEWLPASAETEWLYTTLDDAVYQVNKHFHLELTHISDLQLTEYNSDVEGHYSTHVDNGYGKFTEYHRKLSMSLQLSKPEDYEGGELLLYPERLEPVTVPRVRGLAVFFRSEILHEVKPVTSGVRRSLVMWAIGPELR